jgi:signal transduction histidine kinase
MDALAEIPIVSEEKLRSVTTFLGEMALVFSQLGYAHLVIKENAERLEQEIATRKLAEERQRKSEEQLQQAQKIESIGRLAGGIAHDFNNMLGVILGHTEIALEQVDPALPLHAELNEIQKAARRSADLTRQLLAFSRKQPIVPKVLDLNETVAGMLTMLRRLIGEHINLTWQPGAGLCRVKMDPSQIDQILTNLCVNSRDAITRTGNITVRSDNITLGEAYCADHLDAVPGQYVLLEVIDDGCGMKKNILAHVFEPFFTTKELGKGSGLGLSTVYGIVTQNKGSITANSESGKGTTISIYLPYFEGTPTPTIDDIETEAPTGQGEIVLVVEDEPSMRLTCSRFLETLGYTVLVADTPAAAQDIVARNPGGIHLLLTDILMPGMNGPDLAHSLISLDPNLKCLFMSGYTPTEIIPLIAPGEKVFFIQKPFSRKELAVKVREVLRTRPSDHNAGI